MTRGVCGLRQSGSEAVPGQESALNAAAYFSACYCAAAAPHRRRLRGGVAQVLAQRGLEPAAGVRGGGLGRAGWSRVQLFPVVSFAGGPPPPAPPGLQRPSDRVSVFMGVPTYVHRLLADARLTPELCAHMRLFTCGSAPLSAEVHREFEARTAHRIVERYGATEAMIISSNPMNGERRPGSVGLALPGLDMRITDKQDEPLPVGEIGVIQVRGPGLFSGYWQLPQQTQQEFTPDGYFRTGDLGCVDDNGYLSITGRAKDLIISGGYNVYPVEVETVINQMPQVQESAVVGVPHPDFGETVVAVLVPHDMKDAPTAAEVIAWTRERLANYKLPKRVLVLSELPRNTMGKVLKATLREWVVQGEMADEPKIQP